MSEIHIISLGAGVQSSTMALMAAAGELEPMPTAAIFADTRGEPASVYKWLDWLEGQLPFPVYRVCQAKGLVDDSLRIHERKDGQGTWVPSGIPYYTINGDGSLGHGPRQCTQDFKIIPIQRKIRELQAELGVKHSTEWIGISLDEAHRMKPARVRYITHSWPLIERRMSRHDCQRWMQKQGFPPAPRSACVFCPYHNDREWHQLKSEEPLEFQKAVDFEKAYQAVKAQTLKSKKFVPYLHDSRQPLETVEFDPDKDQLSLFGNECEGMCGV